MFCKSATFFWLVLDKGFHSDGDERRRVVVVGTIHVGLGGDFRVKTGLLYEEELTFGLWDGLAPQMEREGFSGATEDINEVLLPDLDSLLRQVVAVFVRWE